MAKRLLLSVVLILLPALCACGKAGPAATRTDAPPTGTDAAVTATDAAQSPFTAFQLDALPEIGSYRPRTVRYFYDAPLQRFEPSEDYGLLIPYRLHSEDRMMGGLGRFGLMTADGRIVTGPIYSDVTVWQIYGKTWYRAACHIFEENASPLPRWEEDPAGYEEADRRAGDYYRQNLLVQLIPAEGDDCLSVSNADLTPFTDLNTGVSRIVASSAWLEWMGGEGSGDLTVFRVYDETLRPVAELPEAYRTEGECYLLAADETGCVMYRRSGQTEDSLGRYTVLFFENGELVHTLSLGEEPPYEAAGGLIRCPSRLCDRDGSTVVSFDEMKTDAVYDPGSGCYILLNRQDLTLRKIDRNGELQAETRLPSAPPPETLSRCDFGGQTRLVVRCRLSDGDRDVYRVYDGDLRQVCTVGDLNAPAVELTDWFMKDGLHVFTVPGDGTTDLLDLDGNRLATVPFAVTGFRQGNWEYARNADLLLLYNHDRFAVYDDADRSVTLAADRLADPADVFCFDKNAVVLLTDGHSPAVSDWRYSIREMATGRVLLDDVDDLFICPVNGEVWYGYLRRGTVHVCDSSLRDAATLYDDLYS